MKLDSVRELKNILFTKRLMPAGPFQLDASVGIAKNGKGYELAVRLHEKKHPLLNAFLEMVDKMSCGEMQVANVGEIKALQGLSYVDPNSTCPCDSCTAVRASLLPMVAKPQENKGRARPLTIGCSTGHFRCSAGTIGCYATDQSGARLVLSNNHVFAMENNSKAGDAIVQPGPYDGGKEESDKVATLARFVQLKDKGNLVDAAVATLDDGIEFDPRNIEGVGDFAGLYDGEIEPGMEVAKRGRTSSTTFGKITAIEVDNVRVGYSGGVLSFDRQLEIVGNDGTSLGNPGDSGSMIVETGSNKAVALLFAGSQSHTIANYMSEVVKALEIKLVC